MRDITVHTQQVVITCTTPSLDDYLHAKKTKNIKNNNSNSDHLIFARDIDDQRIRESCNLIGREVQLTKPNQKR